MSAAAPIRSRRCRCDRVRKGSPRTPDQCKACWDYWHLRPINLAQGGDGRVVRVRRASPPPSGPARLSLPCVHEGAVLEWCTSCGRKEGRHVRDCDLHDRCTRDVVSTKVRACVSCPDYAPDVPPKGPDPVARLDEKNLCPEVEGRRFNSSLIVHQGRRLLAFRTGWAGSDIYVVPLGAGFQQGGQPVRLDLLHDKATHGREDPRLFVSGDRLHVSYVGVVGKGGRALHTTQLYARLTDDLRVERVFAPAFPGMDGRRWEKNWSFFDAAGGDLHAVYLTHPRHVVLRIDGDRAERVADEPFPVEWPGGEIRGGAAPVRVGNEWWSFAHDRVERYGRQVYRMLLYAFSAEPPFRPLRYLPEPLKWADPSTNPGNYADVVFPCGALLDGGSWLVSCGAHDRFTEVYAFDHADLDRRLVPVG